MRLQRLDHLVLTVRDLAVSCEFYSRVLGMRVENFSDGSGDNRKALRFGQQKINLHEAGREFEPKAAAPTPGSADLCFVTDSPPGAVMAHLEGCGVPVEEGPVERAGALGALLSVYLRDPDGNLIEVSSYPEEG